MVHILPVLLAMFAIGQTASPPAQALEGIKKLAFLVGNWTSTEEVTTSPGAKPVAFTLHGRNDWAMGGSALRIEESFDFPNAGTIHNFILMTYDARAKVYFAYWFTNQSPKPYTFKGGFEGSNLVLTTVNEAGTAGPELRISFKPKSATEMDELLEVKSGETWQVRTVAKYVKGG